MSGHKTSIIIGMATILVILYSLVFIIQTNMEKDIQLALKEQQTKQQQILSQNLASQIRADLSLVVKELRDISESQDAQNGNLGSTDLKKRLKEEFDVINSFTHVNALLVIDENGIVTSQIINRDVNLIGVDLSFRDYVKETKSKRVPYFSNGFKAYDSDVSIIVATHPIINKTTNKYIGLVIAGFRTPDFFNYYGMKNDINSQYFMIIGKDHRIITHPLEAFVGEDLFGEKIQKILARENDIGKINEGLNNFFAGKSDTTTYKFQGVERISSGTPVLINGKAEYYIITVFPTSLINSETSSILFWEKIGLLGLVAIMSGISLVFVVILQKYIQSKEEEKTKKLTAIGELSARLAHDLRNPLSIIKSTSELIQMRSKDKISEKDKDDFLKQNRAIDRMTHQIENVLDFVRIKPLQKQIVQISKILSNAILAVGIPSQITVNMPENDNVVSCDQKQMEVVFINILRNSIQALDGKGQIDIELFDADSQVIINVKDSGHGIPDELVPKVFDPLFTTKQEGTGLGLASCKNIIKNHGGEISVSNNPTTFTIILPR